MSSRNRNRKFDSGAEKRKKKQRLEAAALSQKGSLDRFVVKESEIISEDEVADIVVGVENADEGNGGYANEGDAGHGNIADEGGDGNVDKANISDEGNDANIADNINNSTQPDIFDPRTWDALDLKMIDILLQKGPKRDLSIQYGPKDKLNRRFSALSYNRVLPNGEKCDREGLVYNKELNRVFCFCCKLLRKGHVKGLLVNEGFNDWMHLNVRLKEHETSREHVTNMAAWYECRLRFQNNQTIDKVAQRELEKEKEHWRKVLHMILLIVQFLGERNIAFRGSNCKLYQDNNGNFLGLIQMLAQFDLVMREHVDRITNDRIRDHYLGPSIQNELINLLATAIRSEIIGKIKKAKYFSVLLDCTPNISHQKQMSLIIRYVDVSSDFVSIEESFLGFLEVNDTTGQGLFDVLKDELKSLDLDIDNVRGQGYDNGSNMKGPNKGVQKKLLELNPKVFYLACGCHSLNLTFCDMTKSCRKASDFFGVIQRIYTFFAKSTKRWKILKDNIPGLTLKSLSATRWESRIDSVKAIRFQIPEIREALLQVAETDTDPCTSSEAQSLVENELCGFEFLVFIIIWYEMLLAVNLISRELQLKDMLIDIAIESVQGLISFFSKYRENAFSKALEAAKEIALEMDIRPGFRTKRKIKRKRQFDEVAADASVDLQSEEESFRVNYFLPVVDQAIPSLTRAALGHLVAARLHLIAAKVAAVYHYLNVPPLSERNSERAVASMVTATNQLRPAVVRMKRVGEVHAACGIAFSIFASHIVGLPGWLAWQQLHAATAAHANTALQRLRTAIFFMRRLRHSPPLSPLWNQWGPGVLLALCVATAYLDASTDELRPMQRALVLELFAARRLLLP
ncbi:hypothetical protein BRADI_5g22988v3 [Brachypodium distachyon]|uniref:DUF4371 domain-containing protein n=1 Tax=Brachypodium distachyon TaxID=15368 RepID=A0A2K2CIR2_BRADI|nr:hypothetical protein BRADI_5g22988v3 [Brachypodium distachyon]